MFINYFNFDCCFGCIFFSASPVSTGDLLIYCAGHNRFYAISSCSATPLMKSIVYHVLETIFLPFVCIQHFFNTCSSSTGFVLMNSVNLCLLWNGPYFLIIFKDSFDGCSVISKQTCTFRAWNSSIHSTPFFPRREICHNSDASVFVGELEFLPYSS